MTDILQTRPATPGDATELCALLNRIIDQGGTTGHRTHFTRARMIEHYIAPDLGIATTVALRAGKIIGFQHIAHADPEFPGPGRLPKGWGVIATFVADGQRGLGVGRRLFAETRAAAEAAGLAHIDATIRRENAGGLAYYGGLGFHPYRDGPDTISKRLDLR